MSDTTVILVNVTKRPPRMLTLQLTTDVAPVRVAGVKVEESRQGDIKQRPYTKFVPDSIRIPSKSEIETSASVVRCPEVAAAIARGDLRVKAPEAVVKKSKRDQDATRKMTTDEEASLRASTRKR